MKEKHENATREFTWKNLENRKGDGMGGCFVAPLEEFVAIVKKKNPLKLKSWTNSQRVKISYTHISYKIHKIKSSN